MIQEYISGETIQSILESNKVNIENKLKTFYKFLLLYSQSKSNDNLCLDWNMKNFIFNGNAIYYVDFVPCLYKDKIAKSTAANLQQYRESYLDDYIRAAGILGYAIMPFIKAYSKNSVIEIYNRIKYLFKLTTNIYFDDLNFDENHVYLYKLQKIDEYLNSDMSYDDLITLLNEYSMENVAKRVRKSDKHEN